VKHGCERIGLRGLEIIGTLLERDPKTGLYTRIVAEGRTRNLVVDSAQPVLLQRLFGVAGSARSISKIGVGSGTTAPATSDVALTTELLKKIIQSVDQTGEASLPPSRICYTQFDPTEANGSGTSYIREVGFFFDNNAMVTHALFGQKAITNATQADPVVITSNGHGLSNGDSVFIQSVGGMTELNNNHYVVANKTTNTFELAGVDGTGFTAYTSGGKWTKEFMKNSSRVFQVRYTFGFSA
jgi:hypothetical protein